MERYDVQNRIGQGSFGQVYLVTDLASGMQAVLKKIPLVELNEKERGHAKLEVQLMRCLSHPHIVDYLDSFLHNDEDICIVMTHYEGGDLFALLRECKEAPGGPLYISEDVILHVVTQVILGVQFMHARRVLHRDLKSQNIFLQHRPSTDSIGKGRGGARFHVVVGDLGIAKVLEKTHDMAKTAIGTPLYMSPEVCKGEKYGYASDVWSIGCITYEMAALVHPFQSRDLNSLVMSIINAKYKPLPSAARLGTEFTGFVKKLLSRSPKRRPLSDALLQSPYLRRVASPLGRDHPDIAEQLGTLGITVEPAPSRSSSLAGGMRDRASSPSIVGDPTGAQLPPLPSPSLAANAASFQPTSMDEAVHSLREKMRVKRRAEQELEDELQREHLRREAEDEQAALDRRLDDLQRQVNQEKERMMHQQAARAPVQLPAANHPTPRRSMSSGQRDAPPQPGHRRSVSPSPSPTAPYPAGGVRTRVNSSPNGTPQSDGLSAKERVLRKKEERRKQEEQERLNALEAARVAGVANRQNAKIAEHQMYHGYNSNPGTVQRSPSNERRGSPPQDLHIHPDDDLLVGHPGGADDLDEKIAHYEREVALYRKQIGEIKGRLPPELLKQFELAYEYEEPPTPDNRSDASNDDRDDAYHVLKQRTTTLRNDLESALGRKALDAAYKFIQNREAAEDGTEQFYNKLRELLPSNCIELWVDIDQLIFMEASIGT